MSRKPQGLTRVNVMLDPGTIKAAQGIGFGNLSAGLREAVRRVSGPGTAQRLHKKKTPQRAL